MLGPRSCGKTALLKHFLHGKANVIYLDCRGIDATTPQSFIQALLTALATAAPSPAAKDVLTELWQATQAAISTLKVTEKDLKELSLTVDVPAMLAQIFRSRAQEQQSWSGVFNALRELLATVERDTNKEQAGEVHQWPMLVIDEANRLMAWSDTNPQLLEQLLCFLVQISKQDRRCHVILATSEWGYDGWLQSAIGSQFYLPVTIGDFTEEQARAFLAEELARQRAGLTVDDDIWRLVYEVCGGNAGNLVGLASWLGITSPGSQLDQQAVSAALKVLSSTEKEKVLDFADGGQELGWTSQQYATAALELLRSPHHAVPVPVMRALLGRLADVSVEEQKQAGKAVLQRLIAANALAIRRRSDWAKDLPDAAFADAESVVTAPSAVVLYCMKRLKPLLEGNITPAP